jgi:hypothetical protein
MTYRAVEVEPGCFVRMPVDEEWLDPELRRRRTVDRIRRSFFHPVQGGLQPIPWRPFGGLGWGRSGFARKLGGQRGGTFPAAPWGWRWLKEEYRNAAICLPLWLYWPVYGWRYRWNIVCEPLERWGFLRVKEGDYWWNARLACPDWLARPVHAFLQDRG